MVQCQPRYAVARIDFSFMRDREEPPHIHVERDECEAKFWLDLVRLQWSSGFSAKEIRRIEKIIGAGHGIHWPELDEDISVDGLLAGKPSGES